ncbi:MAG: 1-acyl-sn-glycerol-3-phosphate acyltransferase [Candidatus Nealsonbacteria bacterium]|nr:1-acyl-sn-glycerol-3-phosphate acyltransferase [Candidatus Nealsonbacteria bacterium]
MNRQPYEKPPRWWGPKMSAGWIRFWRPFRIRTQLKKHRLLEVEVRGLEHVRDAVDRGEGVLVTPNHASHADCHALYAAADELGYPVYVMIAWQVFARDGWLRAMLLRHHGGFSIDREGTDLSAIRQAKEILQSHKNPLFIFPEGDVYHCNARITPFREGPAAIALMAAKKADRPVVCIPCAVKYTYLEDPTPELLELMDELERAIMWRPRPDLPLPERIYHFAEGILSLKEIEYLGHTRTGSVRDRLGAFIDSLLGRLESRYDVQPADSTVPERVKTLRQHAIKRMQDMAEEDPRRKQSEQDLGDLFVAVQAFSYPGNYVAEEASIERMAETLDKFEEDVLGHKTARIRGTRKATVTFGEPIPIEPQRQKKEAAAALTRIMEERVQALLDGE